MNSLNPRKSKPATFSLFDVSETSSHYLVSLNIGDAIGDEVSVELTNDALVIRDLGKKGRDPSNRGGQKNVTLKSKNNGYALAALYSEGILFIALPKNSSPPRI